MKQKKSVFQVVLLSGMLMFVGYSCQVEDETPSDTTDIETLTVSPDFKFSTHKDLSVTIYTLDNNDGPVPNVYVSVYTDYPDSSGQKMFGGVTDENGLYALNYQVPSTTDSLVVTTNAIGFVNAQKVAVTNGTLTCTLGGKEATSLRSASVSDVFRTPLFAVAVASTVYKTISTYNSNGVPTNLLSTNDVIDAGMLADINATLPERSELPTAHPSYFSTTNESNMVLTELCNVWVTFIHEGADYRNVFGYYKYKTSKPPTTTSQIDTIFIVFPNVSFNGSGGGLSTGNKMYLGAFPAGTEIGWVLIPNGWNAGKGVSMPVKTSYYSDMAFNPEASASNKQHTVLLNDIGRGKFLLGFEDLDRNPSSGSDNDFNDAVFYVTADPIKAVETNNMPSTVTVKADADADGIVDTDDDYPDDASKAFDNYYPSSGTFGTLAFEDLWSSQGDYDFNDMVVDYNFNQVTNATNKVVQLIARIKLNAMGAGYHNGFGIQLPIAPEKVKRVTGTNIVESYIKLDANGTESEQSNATVIVFDDGYNVLPWASGSTAGVNTTLGATYVTPQELTLTIDLTEPIALKELGTPPYNPFIIVDGDRSKEVHLIDHTPTDLADVSLLGTYNDDSNPAKGRYYVTARNLPFAIDIAETFDYPIEKASITKAFLKFFSWGESGGLLYKDWYKDLKGYRDSKYIYVH